MNDQGSTYRSFAPITVVISTALQLTRIDTERDFPRVGSMLILKPNPKRSWEAAFRFH